MSRILVVGAKGMLGRDLMRVLPSSFSQDEIIGWDMEEIHLEEMAAIDQIEALCPEIIIHLAAYTDVDGCELNETKAFAVNAEGTKHVALAASKVKAKVVYLSTDYIFDGHKKEPYVESDSPNPLNVYGRSKLKGENYIKELVQDFLIIRTQWLYGRHGKNFVDSILRQAKEKKVLTIVDDQIGSPTYTVDLAEAITMLIRHKGQGIFHVTNSGFCSWYTFGQTILMLSGMDDVKVIPLSSKELGRPAVRPSYSVLNCKRLEEEIGFTLRPWPEALKDYLT